MSPAFHGESTFYLPFPRREVWQVMAKTDWLLAIAGWPASDFVRKALPEAGSDLFGSTRLFGLRLRWREGPFEWFQDESYRLDRFFECGPLLEWNIRVELSDAATGETKV